MRRRRYRTVQQRIPGLLYPPPQPRVEVSLERREQRKRPDPKAEVLAEWVGIVEKTEVIVIPVALLFCA